MESESREAGPSAGRDPHAVVKVRVTQRTTLGAGEDPRVGVPLPVKERVAVMHAVEKLAAVGPALPFPHQSNVKGAERLRELRARSGRS